MKHTFGFTDYPLLTYNDLFDMQRYGSPERSAYVDVDIKFCSGAGEMYSEFNVLKHYMVKDSELYDRLYKMIESYLGWQHNSNFNFNGATLNGATALGNNIYILDVSADAGSQMPSGYKQEHRDMNIYVLHDPPTNELFAFSVRDYGSEGAVNIG